jgi:hypothetical protein
MPLLRANDAEAPQGEGEVLPRSLSAVGFNHSQAPPAGKEARARKHI